MINDAFDFLLLRVAPYIPTMNVDLFSANRARRFKRLKQKIFMEILFYYFYLKKGKKEYSQVLVKFQNWLLYGCAPTIENYLFNLLNLARAKLHFMFGLLNETERDESGLLGKFKIEN
jgi:hypothetical protein